MKARTDRQKSEEILSLTASDSSPTCGFLYFDAQSLPQGGNSSLDTLAHGFPADSHLRADGFQGRAIFEILKSPRPEVRGFRSSGIRLVCVRKPRLLREEYSSDTSTALPRGAYRLEFLQSSVFSILPLSDWPRRFHPGHGRIHRQDRSTASALSDS
jgi:hypothetical protein